MFDVVFELAAEVLGEALHRQGGGIAERADGAAHDVVENAVEHVQVFRTALAVLDAMHDLVQPRGAFAAGRALAAGFLVVEEGETLQALTMQVVSSMTMTAPEPSIDPAFEMES